MAQNQAHPLPWDGSWRLYTPPTITSRNDATSRYITAIAQVGTGDGHLYLFENGSTTLTRSVKAHTGSVYTLHSIADGGGGGDGQAGVWSGGKDGLVKFYNNQVRGTLILICRKYGGGGNGDGPAGVWSGGKDRPVKLYTTRYDGHVFEVDYFTIKTVAGWSCA